MTGIGSWAHVLTCRVAVAGARTAALEAKGLWQEAHDLYATLHATAGVAESAARLALLARRDGEVQRSHEYLHEAAAPAKASAHPETLEYIRTVTAELEG